MMARMIGQFGSYEKAVIFFALLERFDYFITANDIDDKKKKSVFLSVIGESTFAICT